MEVDGTEGWRTVPSPLYRLDALAKTDLWKDPLEPWLASNRDHFLSTIGDRRAYALSAVGAGEGALAETSGLSESELAWLRMHVARDSGDLRGAFWAGLNLDPESYPDHALVLLEAVSAYDELIEEPALAAHVPKLPDWIPGSEVLSAALEGAASDDLAAIATELDQLGYVSAASDVRSLAAGEGMIGANAWSRAATCAPLQPSEVAAVAADFPGIVDDMIDEDRVGASSASMVESPYLRARINVEEATDDELRSLDATDELARRAFVSGDHDALAGLGDDESAAVEFYRALDALRNGEVPDVLPEDDTIRAVAASIRAGRAHPNALSDSSTWPVLRALITEEDAERYPEQAAVWQLERALDDLASWNFDSAVVRARSALKWSDQEPIRDEALNVIGFSLHQEGSDEAAISALEKALEGDYSANLQANIGIIAEDLQPEVAAHHLARLAEEAPTIDLQLAAVRHAFGIWTASSDAWDEDGLVLPDDLLSILRSLVVADIPHDDYVSLMQLLARADDDWLVDQGNTNRGPHVDSAVRRVYLAKASHDPSDYVDALAAVSKQGNEEDWFVDEKDSFVDSLRSLIFSEDGSIGPASYAFGAIDAGLELDNFDYVTLASGAAISILTAIYEDDGLPSDKVKDMVVEARRRVRLLDDEQRERLSPLVAESGNRYGAVVANHHAHVHDQILDALRSIGGQLAGKPLRHINWSVVDDAIRPMRSQLSESAREVKEAETFVTDEDLLANLRNLVSGLNELRSKISNPKRFYS